MFIGRQDEKAINKLIGVALTDRKVRWHLLSLRDKTLFDVFGISKDAQKWLQQIETDDLALFADAVATYQRKGVIPELPSEPVSDLLVSDNYQLQIELRTFGTTPRLMLDLFAAPIEIAVHELFPYLYFTGRVHIREVYELFWAYSPNPASALSTTISRINNEVGYCTIERHEQHIGLASIHRIESDAEQFEKLFHRANAIESTPYARKLYEQALQRYTGEFLPNSDWAKGLRETYAQIHESIRQKLAQSPN